MRAATMLAALALIALAGCNQLGAIFGGGEAGANQAQANASSGGGKDPATGNSQVADAGITNSRSFQPLAGSAGGDKVPTAPGQGFDPSLLVGRWGDFGDCTKNVIEILGDGTFRANGGIGAWQIDGNRVSFAGDQATVTITLQSLDANGMVAIQPNGTVGRSQRC